MRRRRQQCPTYNTVWQEFFLLCHKLVFLPSHELACFHDAGPDQLPSHPLCTRRGLAACIGTSLAKCRWRRPNHPVANCFPTLQTPGPDGASDHMSQPPTSSQNHPPTRNIPTVVMRETEFDKHESGRMRSEVSGTGMCGFLLASWCDCRVTSARRRRCSLQQPLAPLSPVGQCQSRKPISA